MNDQHQTFGPGGRYTLHDVLGEGAGGRVFRATDTQLGREVALKQLTRRRSPAEFERRFAALSRLKHPNLVELYSMYSAWEPPFYTMQFVPGVDVVTFVRDAPAEDLDDQDGNLLLGTQSRPSRRSAFTAPTPAGIERAREVVLQLCTGLEFAHSQGFVHRDVTRTNVRVSPAGQVVIMDYGLATETLPEQDPGSDPRSDRTEPLSAPVSELSASGELIGTAAYMAPEQWDSRELSPAVDWYSLGVVLFEALCGALPFVGSAHEVLVRKRTVGAVSPSLLLPEIPDDLDAVCRGLMQSDPKRRWSGARVRERLLG